MTLDTEVDIRVKKLFGMLADHDMFTRDIMKELGIRTQGAFKSFVATATTYPGSGIYEKCREKSSAFGAPETVWSWLPREEE